MNVSFEEIGRMAVTFAQAGCESGQVCKLGSDGQVVPCAAGDKFCGIVESVRGGHAAVQLEGFATVRVSGAVNPGYVTLCADGAGGVKSGSGREYLVVSLRGDTAVIKL